MESEIHQRRAIRLLFQLVPTRLLRMVIRPVFELLAGIANEPTCEVDEYSLAVLFSPILFLDQSTTTPASLANPLPARAVELLVRTALRDLQSHQSLDRTFRVPVLFQKIACEILPNICWSFTMGSSHKHMHMHPPNEVPDNSEYTAFTLISVRKLLLSDKRLPLFKANTAASLPAGTDGTSKITNPQHATRSYTA
ncbi:hypothetical protein CSKR_203461 [Clonorchis sinensis]|uniref:Uncharacterized protein n=1 Tax=Clonorchis sinensis TaxID=79923 RepID=A0A8T1MBW6_CLOSI|nr:hypothetical protein CSKR_203461 [Clonorchis sinensis]